MDISGLRSIKGGLKLPTQMGFGLFVDFKYLCYSYFLLSPIITLAIIRVKDNLEKTI